MYIYVLFVFIFLFILKLNSTLAPRRTRSYKVILWIAGVIKRIIFMGRISEKEKHQHAPTLRKDNMLWVWLRFCLILLDLNPMAA